MRKKKRQEKENESAENAVGLSDALHAIYGLEQLLRGAPGGVDADFSQQFSYIFQSGDQLSALLQDLESKHPSGAMLVNASGQITAITEPMARLLGLESGMNIYSDVLEKEFQAVIRKSIKTLSNALGKASDIVNIQQDGQMRLAAVEPYSAETGLLLLVRLVGQPWNEQTGDRLKRAFKLSPTELELAHLLYQGAKSREIAEQRNRSIDTVRTQIKNILRKTNCGSQSELVSIVAALITEQPAAKTASTSEKITLSNGVNLAFRSYGAEGGFPVLMLHTSSDPFLDKERTKVFQDANLKVFAPYLFDGISKETEEKRVAQVVELCRAFLIQSDIEKCIAVGHREGGIYAAHFAAQYPDLMKGVLAIDTPMPSDGFPPLLLDKKLNKFINLTISYPFVSETAFRLINRLVSQGDKGIRYYLTNMFADDEQLLSDIEEPELFEIAARNARFIFSDCAEIVKLFGLYYSDWCASAEEVSAQMPLRFLQGDKFATLPPELIESYCEANENTSCHIEENVGQFLLYTHTSLVADEIQKLASQK